MTKVINRKTPALLLGLIGAMAFHDQAHAQAETTYTLSFGAISDDFLGRSEQYGILAFDSAAVSASSRVGQFVFDLTVGETFENEAVDSLLIFGDVGYRFGNDNWQVGVGQIERHWSPSEYTSLVLSRNAPAFASAYIRKEEARTSDVPVLRWIGPWNGEIFLGQTDDADQPDNALILGMRLGLEPIPDLEIEFVRVAQYGGTGQPDGLDTFFDVLVGNSNEGDSAPANQIAGVGASYRFGPDTFSNRIYGQAVGEDEAGGLPSCFFFLAGLENKSRLFNADSTITLEYVDTTVNFTDSGFCGPNTAYNNDVYSYRNEGVVMGAAIGSESRSASLRGKHDFDSWALDWNVGKFTINDSSNPDHSLSTARETGTIVSLSARTQLWGGTLQGIIAHQSFDLDTAEQDSGVRVGINFSQSF
ncbi:capsule assembly Wzi family protein [uncultured Tateyamaria sp.]|uniref:capsule assembly Wzi family protein n=1 Tax=uncultured Tateyamaria sp. TaxID=455651 RepID=UPI00261E4D24|nr:capsule assembly Wzi family protein [uncultured Tateyamaria sp.]